MTIYQLTDRLHDGRTAHVPADAIVATISAWLAELGAASPLVEDLAQAVRVDDWPKAHHVADYLSLEVTVAADSAGYGSSRAHRTHLHYPSFRRTRNGAAARPHSRHPSALRNVA